MDTPLRLDCEQCIIISSLSYRAAMLDQKAAERRMNGQNAMADTLEKSAKVILAIVIKLDTEHTEHREAY
jgi:hypothetical protein